MSGDLLFPFPSASFLFVHTVYLFSPADLVTVTDGRGKTTTRLPARVNGLPPVDPVKGYLTAPNASRDISGYISREKIEAVLLVDNSVGIDIDWLIFCEDLQLPPHLKGVYSVDTVRPNISHTRTLLKRYRRQFESESEVY